MTTQIYYDVVFEDGIYRLLHFCTLLVLDCDIFSAGEMLAILLMFLPAILLTLQMNGMRRY